MPEKTKLSGLLLAALLIGIAAPSYGQSDPANFTTVINVPPETAPTFIQSDTQLNLFDGGVIEDYYRNNFLTNVELNVFGGIVESSFFARAGWTVNISGGSVGGDFKPQSRSTVNISGGTVGPAFLATGGSIVNLTGGTVGSRFESYSNSTSLIGGDFVFNGQPLDNSNNLTLGRDDLLTGVLQDGSPFIFAGMVFDALQNAALTSSPTPIPIADLTPLVVDSPASTAPPGLRPGQSLTLQGTGELPANFAVLDAKLSVEAGFVDFGLELSGAQAEVDIAGGIVRNGVNAYDGSTLNISGGSVGSGVITSFRDPRTVVQVFDSTLNVSGGTVLSIGSSSGAVVNISGGTINHLYSNANSVVNVSGGTVLSVSRVQSGSRVAVTGGRIRYLHNDLGSEVTLVGGEFMLNRTPIADTVNLTLSNTDLLTGTLADGSVFIYQGGLNGIALVTSDPPLPPADLTPLVIDAPTANAPPGLRAGQSLTLRDAGVLGNYLAVVDATLNIEGGTVGDGLQVTGPLTEVNVSGGVLGDFFRAIDHSTVNVSGGAFGKGVAIYEGVTANITGGSFSDDPYGDPSIIIGDGGVANIAGGSFDGNFIAKEGGIVNLLGTEFFLDGVELADLSAGETLLIQDREVTLSGVLADGTPFSFDLNASSPSTSSIRDDLFSADATLTVTLIPEPASGVLALVPLLAIGCLRRKKAAILESSVS